MKDGRKVEAGEQYMSEVEVAAAEPPLVEISPDEMPGAASVSEGVTAEQ